MPARRQDSDVGQGPEHVVEVGARGGAQELGPDPRPERVERAAGQAAGAGGGLGALEPRQDPRCGLGVEHDLRGGVDVADDRVLVDHGLALVVAVRVAEVRVERPERLIGRAVGDREHVDAASPTHALHGQRTRELVPGERVVAVVERGCVGAGDHRWVVLGEALHDRAAGLPAGAEVGLLQHRQPRGCGLLQGLALLLVGPGPRLCAARAAARTRRSTWRRGGRRATGTRGARPRRDRPPPCRWRRGNRSTPNGPRAAGDRRWRESTRSR